ncbi:MAG: AAA domain-containing protein, partial [Cyanobacteria bacterium]|nr:AAA domain-containing protein [Cyanobacteriota bacterium]MDW8203108.1 AAA domain-containing protein [Cyanobacteriota bacterium SKYGB_h_bin112]
NKRKLQHDLLRNLKRYQSVVDEFRKLLRWVKQDRILDCMQRIDYSHLSTVFPLWTGEIRDLGRFLPFQPEVFDLVIVDEASQVNIAEIIPAFYRGKSFCVVGDDKQLSLNAAGLFALNRRFERLVWNRCFAGLSRVIDYDRAKDKALIVSNSSILDFIINEDNHFSIPKVTLNEHFRSMPQLAEFTSKTFYDGSLLIMTAVGKNINKPCFEAVRVGGQREASKKLVPEEIEALVCQLKGLIRNDSYLKEPLSQHGFTEKNKPSIGVLSFLTQQRDAIRERLQEEFSEDEWQTYQLLVGTPEEFQGNERNIILITLGLEGLGSRWAKGHYENPNRFNVATSRAINYTYFIYGGIPKTASLLKQYLRHFGYQIHDEDLRDSSGYVNPQETPLKGKHKWGFDETKVESEFEFKVLEYLREFIRVYGANHLELYNQVESCNKRLDFVIFNTRNQDCCAVEVDGVHHFTPDGRTYSEEHFSRVEVLRRAGWKLVHVPYHQWYRNGWLCDRDDREFSSIIRVLFDQIRQALELTAPEVNQP